MTAVGIEAMNVYAGSAYVAVDELAVHRGLDRGRFENLLMRERSVAMPWDDPVTYGVNAARPLIETLTDDERDRIELLVTCSESGIDFGKSMSTYIHRELGLHRNCRLFEVKQACYAGTAGFQMACGFILSQVSPGAKALVVASDLSRFMLDDGEDAKAQDWSYAEPSNGAGAVALLVGEEPGVFQLDVGASGYYGYEVMDTCRPMPDGTTGDAELSLLSYLDCCEKTFEEYSRRVSGADYRASFDYLAFHTPFGGMVKGAHRSMMRRVAKAPPAEIESDFERRVAPGLTYCQRVGNIMAGSLFLSLAGTIDGADLSSARRVGCFSYGSGCCAEFYSGVLLPAGQRRQRAFRIDGTLDHRRRLTVSEYDALLHHNNRVRFGTRDVRIDLTPFTGAAVAARGQLVLREIKDFHREYEWLN